jgi:two-component system, chemotaxis family, response regulator Rcp1
MKTDKHILLIEDNPAQVRLTQEAFLDGNVPFQLSVVYDGEAAIDFLRKRGEYADSIRPDMILLDLNIPKKNGIEVLEEIKSDPDLRMIPVLVLTSSEREEDVSRVYQLQGNCFIKKPNDYEGFIKIAKEIEEFWLGVNRFPRYESEKSKLHNARFST